MNKQNKFCQSCGMPLNKDTKGGGSNADGSKNLLYCSLCYVDGKFTRPDMTAKEMQKFVREKLKEMKMSSILAWFLTLNIPRLKRWK